MGRLTLEQIVSAVGYAADAAGGIALFEAVDEVRLRIVPVLIGDGRSFTPPTSASAASSSTTSCRTRADTWACTTGCAERGRPPAADATRACG